MEIERLKSLQLQEERE